jgi:4'-phosphopantetheinyl transferase
VSVTDKAPPGAILSSPRHDRSPSVRALALAVALDRQVGVDIEVVRPGVDVRAVAEGRFTAGALDWLRALPPQQQAPAFYRLWTREEAISKVSGQGIASPPVATPSPATLHPFQFRLGRTDVIGVLALDARHEADCP